MHNELLHLGGITIYTYGAMYAIGILCAFYVAEKRGKKLGLDVSRLDSIALWILLGGFAGSKILYWITRFGDILKDPAILLDFSQGWVVYGGLIGGLLAGWVYCKKYSLNFWAYFDLIIPEVALAQGFGRIGCFFAGCCYGIEVDAWYALYFPEGSLAPSGTGLFPTQLVMAIYDFLLFFLLCYLAKRMQFAGELGGWYLLFYAGGRFVIEFFRGDAIRGGFGGLSTSQIISLFMFTAGFCIVLLLPKYIKPSKSKES